MNHDDDVDDTDVLLVGIADRIGAEYLMTDSGVLAYLAMGDRRHGAAPEGVCGAADPRFEHEPYWCARPLDHTGNHNRYPDSMTGLRR